MDDKFELMTSAEALTMIASTVGISRDEATRVLAAGTDGVPAPAKYTSNPVYYRSDVLAKWAKKHGKKLKEKKTAFKPKVVQARAYGLSRSALLSENAGRPAWEWK